MTSLAVGNAGSRFSGGEGDIAGLWSYSVIVGVMLGEFSGIYLFTWLAVRMRITSLPQGMDWKNVAGVSLLGGIGFTVSLFIANLSFGATDEALLNQAKLGVLAGTILAGVVGYIVLSFVLPSKKSVLLHDKSME